MPEVNEVRLPNRGVNTQARNPTIMGRLGLNLLSTAIFHFVMNSVAIWSVIPVVLAAILWMFGWKTKPPEAVGQKAASISERVKEAADQLADKPKDIVAGGAIKGVGARVEGKIDDAKQDVIDAIEKKAQAKAAAEREELIIRARGLGVDFAEDWSTDKLRAEVEQAEREKEIKALTDEATRLNYGVNPDWDLPTLRKQVKLARDYANADQDYQLKRQKWEEAYAVYRQRLEKGPNAACPRCRYQLRFPKSRIGTQFVCPKCTGILSVRMALANFTPPPPPREPQPPKMNAGILGSFFK